MQGAPECSAIGALGRVEPTLADERLDFAVPQLNGHADELAGAPMAGEALTFGGQKTRQSGWSSSLFRLRNGGEVFVHSLQSEPRKTCFRDPKTGEFSFAYCGIQTVSAPLRADGRLVTRDIVELPSIGYVGDISDLPTRAPFCLPVWSGPLGADSWASKN